MQQSVTETKYSNFQKFCQPMKENGKDLYTHVTKVMSHLVRHTHPSQSLQKFEEVSYLLKNPKLGEKYLLTAINKDYARPCDKSLEQSTKQIQT